MTTRTRIGRLLTLALLAAPAAGATACAAVLGFQDGTLIETESGTDANVDADPDAPSANGDAALDARDAAKDALVALDAADAEAAVDAGPKLAFETPTKFNGRLDATGVPGGGGLAAADARCNDEARTLLPGRTFVAWLSTTGTTAKSRLAGGGPWYVGANLLGPLADLTTGNLHTKLDKGPDGITMVGDRLGVWTGTEANGTSNSFQCANWTSIDSADSAEVGNDQVTGDGWTYATLRTCESTYHLYCFEK